VKFSIALANLKIMKESEGNLPNKEPAPMNPGSEPHGSKCVQAGEPA
jgi:hypothetical protein